MKKKGVLIGVATALAVLVAAGSAFAAIDNYTAGYTFHGGRGTKAKPAAISFNQHFALTAVTPGALTGVLSSIKTKISGVKVDATGFPTCSVSKINAARDDTSCPKKALIATGSITAALGTKTNYTPQQLACDPTLDVWNAGKGKLAFFFVTTATHQCLSGDITTGETPAFPATYSSSGSGVSVNIPIPSAVTDPGDGPYLAAVSSETLNWHSTSLKGHHDITSTGCKGKRHFSYSFAASVPTGASETKTITGTAACG